jgi:hypothetical protein
VYLNDAKWRLALAEGYEALELEAVGFGEEAEPESVVDLAAQMSEWELVAPPERV